MGGTYKELAGRTAIVTGAGSPRGMGRAIVETLAGMGANIVASDTPRPAPDPVMEALQYKYGADEGLEETVAAAKERGVEAIAAPGDITDQDDMKGMAKTAMDTFGRIDILVNVAGGAWGSNRITDYDPEDWMKTIRTNLFGTFLATNACLQFMENQGAGAIVNIASIAGVRSLEMLSAYGASKAGIIQFTRDIAVESGPKGVRAYALMPGDIDTDMYRMEARGYAMMHGETEENFIAKSAGSTPMGRIGLPSDIAELTAFLCTDRAAFLTGLVIPVTGGKELAFRGTQG